MELFHIISLFQLIVHFHFSIHSVALGLRRGAGRVDQENRDQHDLGGTSWGNLDPLPVVGVDGGRYPIS